MEENIQRYIDNLNNRLNADFICTVEVATEIVKYLLEEVIEDETPSDWLLVEVDGKGEFQNVKDIANCLIDNDIVSVSKIYLDNKELYDIQEMSYDGISQIYLENDVVFIQEEIVKNVDFTRISADEIKII
jgi:hypothetical protein